MFRAALAGLLAIASLLRGQATDLASDAALWNDFAAWVETLKPLPPGHTSTFAQTYGLHLLARGVPKSEFSRLIARVNRLRRASPEREAVYWNAAFKLGNGPSQPSRLLMETIRGRQPGRALDAAMGRGRNALYLASQGWDVTGYDMSADAVAQAQADAARAGVKLRALAARHETFDFGSNQWDLIVCLYNYMDPDDPNLPARFYRALRPGGIVVFQTATPEPPTRATLERLWRAFRILLHETLPAGAVADEWRPSLTYPTVKLVLEKLSPGK